jgi:hypothetical protein
MTEADLALAISKQYFEPTKFRFRWIVLHDRLSRRTGFSRRYAACRIRNIVRRQVGGAQLSKHCSHLRTQCLSVAGGGFHGACVRLQTPEVRSSNARSSGHSIKFSSRREKQMTHTAAPPTYHVTTSQSESIGQNTLRIVTSQLGRSRVTKRGDVICHCITIDDSEIVSRRCVCVSLSRCLSSAESPPAGRRLMIRCKMCCKVIKTHMQHTDYCGCSGS